MYKTTVWQHQDLLHLSVEQWREALQNPKIFNANALRMLRYICEQHHHQSTATDIAHALSTEEAPVHYNKICAWNRKVAKALYRQYFVEPPFTDDGQKRYWNIIFDGNPETPIDSRGYFYWIVRPNLVEAFALTQTNSESKASHYAD